MITIPPDLASLTIQQLRQLQASATQNLVTTQGLDFISASRQAKLSYPELWAESERRGDQLRSQVQPPAISNEARASAAASTNTPENCRALGLCDVTTDLGEYQAALKGARSLANPSFQNAFDAVSEWMSKQRGISLDAAKQLQSQRHPNLKVKADSESLQKRLQQGQPDANAGFQRVTQPTPPARNIGSSAQVENPFVNL